MLIFYEPIIIINILDKTGKISQFVNIFFSNRLFFVIFAEIGLR